MKQVLDPASPSALYPSFSHRLRGVSVPFLEVVPSIGKDEGRNLPPPLLPELSAAITPLLPSPSPHSTSSLYSRLHHEIEVGADCLEVEILSPSPFFSLSSPAFPPPSLGWQHMSFSLTSPKVPQPRFFSIYEESVEVSILKWL